VRWSRELASADRRKKLIMVVRMKCVEITMR